MTISRNVVLNFFVQLRIKQTSEHSIIYKRYPVGLSIVQFWDKKGYIIVRHEGLSDISILEIYVFWIFLDKDKNYEVIQVYVSINVTAF